jgi:hypothetical protein
VRELLRVRKPAGRLVAGEFLDRHYVPIVDLLRYGNAARLELSGRLGPPLAYLFLRQLTNDQYRLPVAWLADVRHSIREARNDEIHQGADLLRMAEEALPLLMAAGSRRSEEPGGIKATDASPPGPLG